MGPPSTRFENGTFREGHDTWEPVDQLQGSHVKGLINAHNQKLRTLHGQQGLRAASPFGELSDETLARGHPGRNSPRSPEGRERVVRERESAVVGSASRFSLSH